MKNPVRHEDELELRVPTRCQFRPVNVSELLQCLRKLRRHDGVVDTHRRVLKLGVPIPVTGRGIGATVVLSDIYDLLAFDYFPSGEAFDTDNSQVAKWI
jgi:hypothetical protein